MSDRDSSNSKVAKLTDSLRDMERKLAEREALLSTAFNQTDAVRSQYAQAVERADALHRRVEAKEEELKSVQAELETNGSELEAANHLIEELNGTIASLRKELRQRDDRISTLERQRAEDGNALEAIHRDVNRGDAITDGKASVSTVYVLESLDNLSAKHRVSRTTTTIGRASTNDVSIDSSSVSRYHARLVLEADGLILVDLESTNGCAVNGQIVTRKKLADGDAISIGEAKFRLSVQPLSAEFGDDTVNKSLELDDQRFTRTVVTLNR